MNLICKNGQITFEVRKQIALLRHGVGTYFSKQDRSIITSFGSHEGNQKQSCQIYKWPLIITQKTRKKSHICLAIFALLKCHEISRRRRSRGDSKKEIKQIACAVTNCKVVPWPLEMASKWRHQNYCHGCDFPYKSTPD